MAPPHKEKMIPVTDRQVGRSVACAASTYLIEVSGLAVEGKAGRSEVGSLRSHSSLPLGRDKMGLGRQYKIPQSCVCRR